MKKLLLLFLILVACKPETTKVSPVTQKDPYYQVEASFIEIMESSKLLGTILIYDQEADTFYSNDFEWAKKGQLPASTFKIPNSIIALESGVVSTDSTIITWDGEPRRMKAWETDLSLKEAFLRSCLPCYQKLARQVGLDQMKNLSSKLDYGHLEFDSTDFDSFWVQGESKISPFEQIDFLERLADSELPISDRTDQLIKKIMILDEGDEYVIRAKTGWSIVENHNNGWFVGYLSKDDRKYFFATNVEPGEGFDMDDFAKFRKQITMEAFAALEIIYGSN